MNLTLPTLCDAPKRILRPMMGPVTPKRVLSETNAAEGVRYLGSERGRHYCYPTCGGVETLVVSNTVRFHTAAEAAAAGYHPCEDCRPPVARAS